MPSVAPRNAALDGRFYGREALTFRVYHYLSHFEIAGGKRISQHLSGPNRPGPYAKASLA
jgi:hypothetical protein